MLFEEKHSRQNYSTTLHYHNMRTIRTFNAAFKKRFFMTPSEYSRSMERGIPAEPSC